MTIRTLSLWRLARVLRVASPGRRSPLAPLTPCWRFGASAGAGPGSADGPSYNNPWAIPLAADRVGACNGLVRREPLFRGWRMGDRGLPDC